LPRALRSGGGEGSSRQNLVIRAATLTVLALPAAEASLAGAAP
jgi:hypothetical protein